MHAPVPVDLLQSARTLFGRWRVRIGCWNNHLTGNHTVRRQHDVVLLEGFKIDHPPASVVYKDLDVARRHMCLVCAGIAIANQFQDRRKQRAGSGSGPREAACGKHVGLGASGLCAASRVEGIAEEDQGKRIREKEAMDGIGACGLRRARNTLNSSLQCDRTEVGQTMSVHSGELGVPVRVAAASRVSTSWTIRAII